MLLISTQWEEVVCVKLFMCYLRVMIYSMYVGIIATKDVGENDDILYVPSEL